jgi:hypothetical protein
VSGPLVHAWKIEVRRLIPLDRWEELCGHTTDRGIDPPPGWGYQGGALIQPLLYEVDTPHDAVRAIALDRMTVKGCHLLDLRLRRLEPAPWHLTWFAHATLRLGRSDDELLSSFATFVDASERDGDGYLVDRWNRRSLMGAEDMWRRKLCTCEKCVAGPEVAIEH